MGDWLPLNSVGSDFFNMSQEVQSKRQEMPSKAVMRFFMV
jgi:hypothetical protein